MPAKNQRQRVDQVRPVVKGGSGSALSAQAPVLIAHAAKSPARGRDDIDAAAAVAEGVDRLLHACAARVTLGISTAALTLAFHDWWLHLAASPGKQTELLRKARHANRCALAPISPMLGSANSRCRALEPSPGSYVLQECRQRSDSAPCARFAPPYS